ncbi:hypothetical protein LXL04_037289 [Taraxacum kok-saghyz]
MSKIITVLFKAVITITIDFTVTSINDNHKTALPKSVVVKPFPKRLSRFLAEEKNPRAADHCKKNDEICYC